MTISPPWEISPPLKNVHLPFVCPHFSGARIRAPYPPETCSSGIRALPLRLPGAVMMNALSRGSA